MSIQSKPRAESWTSNRPRGGRDNYRRKWKPTPPERRANAARSLTDVFRGVRFEWLVLILLAVSLAAHGVTVWVTSGVSAARNAAADLNTAQGSYLEKVLQKQKAKVISRRVAGQITMPPPPPEPETVVEQALAESLAGDVAKITGNLLDVKLQAELAGVVKSNLKDELEAASKDIAQGKLTEDEIRDLHRKFQARAHDITTAWRQDYLEKHQAERAAVSTTDWYERDVSKTLFRNIYFELWTPPGYKSHPPSPERWHGAYAGRYGWEKYLWWGGLRSDDYLRGKIAALRATATGKWPNAGGKGKNEHPAWPGPSGEHAQAVAARLNFIHEGRASETYPDPSWKCAVRGSWERPAMCSGILREFHPHRMEQAAAQADKLDEMWKALLAQAEQYQAKADSGAAPAELAAARDACVKGMEELAQAAGALLPKDPNVFHQANWAQRLDMLCGPQRDQMYRFWVDTMTKGLEPLIRDFARGQFKKGIIKHDAGIEQAMKEFPDTILPLLKRDLERLLPPKRFFSLAHAGGTRGYTSGVTGQGRDANEQDVKAELAGMEKLLAAGSEEDRRYVQARRALLEEDWRTALNNVTEAVLEQVLTGGLLLRQMSIFVEGVDYSDKVQETLDARAMALKGRGQDLARLTADGVPDTSAPLVALMLGASKGHGANLEPVTTSMMPAMFGNVLPEAALMAELPVPARAAAKWGFEEQATVKPSFANSPRFEGIPFLPRFPRLDGDLSDWGRVRPLMLRPSAGGPAILVYAAWNYQGFFFGYRVEQPAEKFYWPSFWQQGHNHNTGDVIYSKATGVDWALRGDHLRLTFDTLDARNDNRGEPHTQEFVIFPQGSESDPGLPGIERVIASQRDAERKEYRGIKADGNVFPQQPPPENGPDGTGPYRITRAGPDGYCTEVFIPRAVFKHPVFAPGWYIGFDCAVASGIQGGNNQFQGQAWATNDPNRPDRWGDLLLLGTDARVLVQQASTHALPVYQIVPGCSYLLTVVDPDRNVHPGQIDTVLVSAEVNGGNNDVEVFVLKETKENSGIFRGYINTQPGIGREVQGVLEVMPLQELRLGYVDFANAKGQRNVITEIKLPIVAPLTGAPD